MTNKISFLVILPTLGDIKPFHYIEGEKEPLEVLQEVLGGFPTVAHRFENGDVLYISESALEECANGDSSCASFILYDKKNQKAISQPLVGRGVIIGGDDLHGDKFTSRKTDKLACGFGGVTPDMAKHMLEGNKVKCDKPDQEAEDAAKMGTMERALMLAMLRMAADSKRKEA